MLHFRSLIFLFSIFVVANAKITKAKQHPKIQPVGITQRFGVGDVFAFVPGITKQDVCNTCLKVLTAIKGQTNGGIQQGTGQIRGFINAGCDSLSSALAPVGLTTLNGFCREIGARVLSLSGSALAIPLGFINPQVGPYIQAPPPHLTTTPPRAITRTAPHSKKNNPHQA